MKIINKFMLALILVISLISVLSRTVLAVDEWDTMKNKADDFIQVGKQNGGDSVISEDKLSNFAMPIARTLLAIASVVVTVVTVIVGIQYAMSNPADKAKVKQKLIGLVVSVIVIYGAQGIWAMLYNFMNTVTN